MPKFRTKSVVKEAMRFEVLPGDKHGLRGTLKSANEISEWAGRDKVFLAAWHTEDDWCSALSVYTLEGRVTARPGDWIIKGVNGEFYPCKPDIFEKTYEPVEE